MKYQFTIVISLILFVFSGLKLSAQNPLQELDSIFQEGLNSMDQYNFKKAAECFYICQRNDNDQPQYHYYLGRAYEQLGNIQDARIFYRKAFSLDSLQVKYIMALGNIELRRHDYRAARKYFEELVNIDSTNSYYYKQLGNVCHYDNDLSCAIHSLEYSIYYNNRDLDAIGTLAQIYYENQDYDICLDWVRKGLFLDNVNPKFLNLKLKSEVKNEAYMDAVITAERILELHDSSIQTLKYYGIALCKSEKFEKSIQILLGLVEDKEDEGIHYYLAESYAALDSLEKSIEHLEAAAYRFGISPMVWRYFWKLSSLYEKTGHTKEALEYIKRAYDLHDEPLLLYQIARLTDQYYQDKYMAINRYDQYLATGDTLYQEYTKKRISELKQFLHQSKKGSNE